MANEPTQQKTISFGSCYKDIISSDVLKAVITAFFTAFFASLLVLLPPILDRTDAVTWAEILVVIKASVAAGLAALSRKYFTNSVGQVFRKDPPNVDNSAVIKN